MDKTYMLEVEENDKAYFAKVGLILVLHDLQIVTSDQYWNLSCSYAGFKLGDRTFYAQSVL